MILCTDSIFSMDYMFRKTALNYTVTEVGVKFTPVLDKIIVPSPYSDYYRLYVPIATSEILSLG